MCKKYTLMCLAVVSLFLAGCGGTEETTVTVQNLSFRVPTNYISVSPQSLDNAQIAHTIIAARKADDGNSNIVLAESTLPAGVSLKEFSEKTQTRLSQELIGYANPTIVKKTFTCNDKKIDGFLHIFEQTALQDNTKTIGYYNQYYFLLDGSIYTLSLAQKEKKSIVNNIISSLVCKQS